MKKPYNDFAGRNGSKTDYITQFFFTLVGVAVIIIIIDIVGSIVYGKEGFVDLLASFF